MKQSFYFQFFLLCFLLVGAKQKGFASPTRRCAGALQSQGGEPALKEIPSAASTGFRNEAVRLIEWRIHQGDIDKPAAKAAIEQLQRSVVVPSDLVGEGFKTCYGEFGTRAVDSIHRLLSSLKGVSSTKEILPQLERKYAEIFKVTPSEAKSRLCILAGAGPLGTAPCRIFGKHIAQQCH